MGGMRYGVGAPCTADDVQAMEARQKTEPDVSERAGRRRGRGRRTEARDAGVVCGELPGRDAAGNKISDGKWRSTQGEGSQRGRTLEEQWAEGPGGRR